MAQYSEFIELVRSFVTSGIDDPFSKSIKKAIKTGVLRDYLERKSTEVENMILTEYDYDTDIAVQREEAFEEGLLKGAKEKAIETAKNFLKMGLSLEQVSQGTNLSLEEVKQLDLELKG